MAPLPTTFLTPLLAILSLYAAQKSYMSITNLQKYEERSEKAAKHLDKAARELYKTRVTQASGAAAVRILSLLFSPFYEEPSRGILAFLQWFGLLLLALSVNQSGSWNDIIVGIFE